MALTFRRAVRADSLWIPGMMTTPVAGVSPLDELTADFGGTPWSVKESEVVDMIADGMMELVVCIESAGTIPRGFNVFVHADALTPLGVPAPDAWQSALTVTDKNLSLTPTANRKLVFRGMLRAAMNAVPATTYLWGDVKAGGNLDTLMQPLFARFPVDLNGVACWRYYATAAQVLAVI